MRKLLHFFVTLLFVSVLLSGIALPVLAQDDSGEGSEPADISASFTDANFRAAVYSAARKTAEQPLYATDVANINQLNIANKNIASLAGIEYLTGLTTLDCSQNNLKSIDLSKNTALKTLSAGSCGLLSLNLTANTALQILALGNDTASAAPDNVFTTLDLSQNTALKELWLTSNWLSALDLSHNTKLEELGLDNVGLSYLDLSSNVALKKLYISQESVNTRRLTSLDISNNAALTYLNCNGQQMTALDASKNTKLTQLYCENNDLTLLNVSGCAALETLNCGGNQLTALDLSTNTKLKSLRCEYNKLTSLDISACLALGELNCSDNQLTTLDVSANIALKTLYCARNMMPLEPVGLENLNLDGYEFQPQNVAQAVDIADQFTDENFKAAIYELLGKEPGSPIYDFEVAAVASLDVSGREIASLAGIEYFTGLEILNCSTNLLTELDLTHNVNLRELDCSHNLMLQPPTGIDTAKLERYVFDPQDVKKPLSAGFVILIVVVLLALGGGGAFVWMAMQKKDQKKKKKPVLKTGATSMPSPLSDNSLPEMPLSGMPQPELPSTELTAIFDRVSAPESRPVDVSDFTPEAKPVEDPFIARFQQSVSQKIKETETSPDNTATREIDRL